MAIGLGYNLDRAIFGPALLLAVLVVVLAGAASMHVPIDRVTPFLGWSLVAFFAALLWRPRRPRTVRLLAALGLLAGLAVWLTLVNCSGHLLPPSSTLLSLRPDTWSYEAGSDYLRRFPRGQTAGMPMVDEFGAHMRNARFASATLLAFFQGLPLLGGVAAAHLVFVVVCVATHFFAMLALGRALNLRANWSMPLFASFLATAGGWLSDVIDLSNNDGLVFAALSPALLALLCPGPVGFFSTRWLVRSGALIFGAMLYNYPEGVALLGVISLPLIITVLLPGDRWREGFGILVLGGLLASPYIPIFASFLRVQIGLGLDVHSVRPYEGVFPGLISNHWLPASFALGEEQQGSSYHLADNFVPLCLFGLVAVGAYALGRRQKWFAWLALPFIGLWFWQGAAKHYDYGAYKVLALAAWWIYPAISAGLYWLGERFAWGFSWRAGAFAATLLAVGSAKYEHRVPVPPALDARMKALSELATLHFVTGQSTILLALDDDMDHLWATYYLRDVPLATRQQRSYLAMSHIAPYLAAGIAPPPESAAYLLVSGPAPQALWHNGRFSLLRVPELYLAGIENPNGIEEIAGERFLWLGTAASTWHIVAGREGPCDLCATAFGIGPSLPGEKQAAVEITDARGTHVVPVRAETRAIPLFLRVGDNAVRLRVLGSPEPGPHAGDNRELMLCFKGPRVAPSSEAPEPASTPAEAATISAVSNPTNNEDRVGTERVFWLGTEPLVLTVLAAADGSYELHSHRFTPGPSLAGVEQRTLQIVDAGPARTVVVDAHSSSIALQLRQGENKVQLRCLDRPTSRGLPNGDTRELLLALSDLTVTKAGTP